MWCQYDFQIRLLVRYEGVQEIHQTSNLWQQHIRVIVYKAFKWTCLTLSTILLHWIVWLHLTTEKNKENLVSVHCKNCACDKTSVLLNSLRWWICKIIVVSFLIPLRGLAKWVLYGVKVSFTMTAKYPFLVNVPCCFLTTPHEGILAGWRQKSLSPKIRLEFKSLQHLVKCRSQKLYGRFDKNSVNEIMAKLPTILQKVTKQTVRAFKVIL